MRLVSYTSTVLFSANASPLRQRLCLALMSIPCSNAFANEIGRIFVTPFSKSSGQMYISSTCSKMQALALFRSELVETRRGNASIEIESHVLHELHAK